MPDNYAAAAGNARHIDVSYFAAGILANLLDCGPWTFEPTSDHCNQSLVGFFFQLKNKLSIIISTIFFLSSGNND